MGTEKRERMITDEAKATQSDSQSRIKVWLECFNESAKAVNKMFGTDISAEMEPLTEEGGEAYVNDETYDDRDV